MSEALQGGKTMLSAAGRIHVRPQGAQSVQHNPSAERLSSVRAATADLPAASAAPTSTAHHQLVGRGLQDGCLVLCLGAGGDQVGRGAHLVLPPVVLGLQGSMSLGLQLQLPVGTRHSGGRLGQAGRQVGEQRVGGRTAGWAAGRRWAGGGGILVLQATRGRRWAWPAASPGAQMRGQGQQPGAARPAAPGQRPKGIRTRRLRLAERDRAAAGGSPSPAEALPLRRSGHNVARQLLGGARGGNRADLRRGLLKRSGREQPGPRRAAQLSPG